MGWVKGEAVIDDHGWLHDPQTRGCGENAWDCFKHPQMLYYYRPLLGISFVFGKRWFHVSPQSGHDESFPFHVENLVQHGLVVLLVFWLLRLLFRRDCPPPLAARCSPCTPSMFPSPPSLVAVPTTWRSSSSPCSLSACLK